MTVPSAALPKLSEVCTFDGETPERALPAAAFRAPSLIAAVGLRVGDAVGLPLGDSVVKNTVGTELGDLVGDIVELFCAEHRLVNDKTINTKCKKVIFACGCSTAKIFDARNVAI